MEFTILVRLIFAHVMADFLLQSDAMCKGKCKKDWQGLAWLFLHSTIHATLAYIVVGDWYLWQVPVVIFFSHFCIDWLKTKKMRKSIPAFLLDQLLHLVIVVALWNWAIGGPIPADVLLSIWENPKVWVFGTAYLIVLKPSSLLLTMFFHRWTGELGSSSLPNAGKWIGYLERLLILTFILIGNFEAIGFLLAAKSVFRFGELSKARDIRTTEYVLIGTLSSFAIAILVGLVANNF